MSIRVMSDVFNVDTFWTWAVAQWSDSILAAEMMALQEEHDCVVLELLLMGWLGRQHWAVSQGAHRQLADTASLWLNGVVVPLRRTRRSWRESDDLESQRQQLQSLELKAEYALAELYFGALDSLDSSELVQAEGPTVIENLHIALARAHATITPERILGLGALLLK